MPLMSCSLAHHYLEVALPNGWLCKASMNHTWTSALSSPAAQSGTAGSRRGGGSQRGTVGTIADSLWRSSASAACAP